KTYDGVKLDQVRSIQECRIGGRHQLQESGFREGPEWLRRGPEQPGQGHARKVPQGAEARRETHFYLRPAGYSVRQRERVELVLPASHAPFELPHPEEGQAARYPLLVCFHAGQWRAVKQDHVAHRIWRRTAGRGSDL